MILGVDALLSYILTLDLKQLLKFDAFEFLLLFQRRKGGIVQYLNTVGKYCNFVYNLWKEFNQNHQKEKDYLILLNTVSMDMHN